MSGFSAFILTLSKSGNILFRKIPNGDCLVSSASLSFVGDTSLAQEHRVMAAVELHVKCNILHLVLKSIYEKSQQENALRCNNRYNLLYLTVTLKISIFSGPIYNPVEDL